MLGNRAADRFGQGATLLYLPAAVTFSALFAFPMLGLIVESLRTYVPGSIGAADDAPFTLANYAELVRPSFATFFLQTLRISLLAALAGILLSLPLAYWMARKLSPRWRAAAIGFFVTLMFLSVLVRTYSLELTFGATGPFAPLLQAFGIATNSRGYIEFLVGIGLLHYIIPMSVLTLFGTFQSIDPRLADAAQALGAPAWKAHLTVTLPLCVRGLLAAFLFAFTFAISAFVIPMILGKGRVLFVSNLVYTRFSEIANYPSGAAIAVVLFVLAMLVVYGLTRLVNARWKA
jgi:ABC-type spermidine/putrescine transport system permease subunit I